VILALLLLHTIAATLLLGAVSHQAIAVCWTARPGVGFWTALRNVNTSRYVRPTIVLYLASVILGSLLYPDFRLRVRLEWLDQHLPAVTGLFEMKEHFTMIGMALLPSYAAGWRGGRSSAEGRRITVILAVVVWWNFLTGLIANNARGL
jgi:hypothetical protein